MTMQSIKYYQPHLQVIACRQEWRYSDKSLLGSVKIMCNNTPTFSTCTAWQFLARDSKRWFTSDDFYRLGMSVWCNHYPWLFRTDRGFHCWRPLPSVLYWCCTPFLYYQQITYNILRYWLWWWSQCTSLCKSKYTGEFWHSTVIPPVCKILTQQKTTHAQTGKKKCLIVSRPTWDLASYS